MKTFFLATSLIFALLPCCIADTNSIIGTWQTDEVLSQLGPSVTTQTFNTNGTYTLSTKFTQGLIPTMRLTGTYHVVTNGTDITNQLVTFANGRTNIASCYFEESTLVIDQGRPTKIFKLKRKP